MSKIRIYISSTFEDLKDCRRAVHDELRRMGTDFEIVCMENYVASDQRPSEKCIDDVRTSLIYIGIFAMRYGYVPDEATNPEGRSITELEFRQASSQKHTETLCFVSTEEFHTPIEQDRKKLVSLLDLRDEVSQNQNCGMFRNADDLANKVRGAVAEFIEKSGGIEKLRALQRSNTAEPAKGAVREYVEEVGTPKDILRLPEFSYAGLLGREHELAQLDQAWQEPHTNVFCLIGSGGLGKSSIVNEWIIGLAALGFQGVDSIFGWSFYSQEPDQQEVSADLFVSEAFRFFGLTTSEVPLDPRYKGHKLAELVQRKRTVLVLDGLEAIQSPSGQLKDQAVLSMLKEMVLENRGLCIVTSQLAVPVLQPFVGKTLRQVDLGPLPMDAGVGLLHQLEVEGPDEEFTRTVTEYDGHPGKLELLGGFLVAVRDSDISRRHELFLDEDPSAIPDEDEDGGKVSTLRLLKANEKFLGEGPELDLLRVLSVFNGPAPLKAIDAVITAPAIPGMTDHISRANMNRATARLHKHKLLAGERNNSDVLDSKKVARDHFATLLNYENRAAWMEANSRLFDYYRRLPVADQPTTMDEMAPLYKAVAHGCRAGRFQEAWDDVEWKRIRREDEGFAVVSLGGWSEDLRALEHFFQHRWERPVSDLDETARAWLLTEAAFDLRGLGRLDEAIGPLRAGLKLHKERGDLWAASDAAGNLSEQLILCADFSGAEDAVEESVLLALKAVGVEDRHDAVAAAGTAVDDQLKQALVTLATNLATRAEVLHHRGLLDEAYKAYSEAEELYTRVRPEIKYLHGARGYHYCELLLDRHQFDEVIQRTEVNAELDGRNQRLHGVGLAQIAQAKAMFLKPDSQLDKAAQTIDKGLETLRRAGHQELLLRAYLAAAQLHCLVEDFSAAEKLVKEVAERTKPGCIRLLEIDSQLAFAQLELARGNTTPARDYCDLAEEQVNAFGYGRKSPEIAAMRARLDA